MKKFIIVLIAFVFMVGCSSNQSKTKETSCVLNTGIPNQVAKIGIKSTDQIIKELKFDITQEATAQQIDLTYDSFKSIFDEYQDEKGVTIDINKIDETNINLLIVFDIDNIDDDASELLKNLGLNNISDLKDVKHDDFIKGVTDSGVTCTTE